MRTESFGQGYAPTPVDKFGVWLSARQIRRWVKSFTGKRVGDFGCGYHASFSRTLLGEVESLVLADCATALDRCKKTVSSPVEHVLWRGADAIGRAAFWLMRLTSGSHALLGKLGRRWTLVEGALDDVLASVPKERFAEAVAATQGQRSREGS